MSEPPRPSSQTSNDEGIEEESALLTGERTFKTPSISSASTRSKWREIGLFVWALISTAAVVVLAVIYQHSQAESSPGCIGDDCGSKSQPLNGKRNLIMMVSDGMGPSSLSLTRSWRHYTENVPYNEALVLDEYLIGQSRTRSSNSLVTDSAAGATAFSCGLKSYNGAISVLPGTFEPCGSVMEAAKRKGYTTGLVVTTRITDATPAVFVSHARRREMEDGIARQMVGETHPLGRMVDLMFGGGRCRFLPNETVGGCRADGVDVTAIARREGWRYVDSKEEFDGLDEKVELPLLGLFAGGDIPYEIDRLHQEDVYPSLEAMTKTALRTLAAATKNSEQGFFIMIEGSRIDHAGHANDPAAQVHEILAYDRAMAAVLDFIKHEETPTLMVATSDHETGGLAVARQLHREYPPYLWYPGVLANASHSASYVAHEYHNHLRQSSISPDANEDLRTYLTTLSSTALGIPDSTAPELDALIAEPRIAAYTFADMISRRAQTGWSTHGHSGADVNIYASDHALAASLRGNHENTEVGEFLRGFLGLGEEVEEVTRLLREHMLALQYGDGDVEGWLGKVPEAEERLDGQIHLEEFAGDHRTRGCEICGVL